jgi:hypothetical protein
VVSSDAGRTAAAQHARPARAPLPLLVPPAAAAHSPFVRAITGLSVYVATVTAPVFALAFARTPH